jgi:proteasome lid subunit RPN8/RPN11
MGALVVVPALVVTQTLRELRRAGADNRERVVLWLGAWSGNSVNVSEAFVPLQEADEDYFWIPPRGMSELLSHLRQNRLMTAAQVHSHPEHAFHSEADDRWAIVRHEGALSLVVPFFGLNTTEENFIEAAAVFQLSKSNRWLEVPTKSVHRPYQIK